MTRALWLAIGIAGAVVLISGCAVVEQRIDELTLPIPAAEVGRESVLDPACHDESYDFAGESTLAALGLPTQGPGGLEEGEINKPGFIWVTHNEVPLGQPPQMARMLCWELEDGGGGTHWPVDPAWEPPGIDRIEVEPVAITVPQALAVLAAAAALIGLSVLAFRRRH